MRKVEILAPAGSYESMQAAVNAGCDAVYIGGSQFGARAFADNLSVENLKKAMDFVHIRDKKLYLTVNTLLKEEELKEQLYDYLLPFYEHGLDAVIVQDIGVMSFIHKAFPELPIHASTQMSLTGSRGANGLKSLGVTRFVPARELSLEELRDIRRETDLEIETFVHGALCYCYSGQCLLSSMIGGRSGNRGRCAQPCRMQYRLPDGKTGYFMSPKDICTLELIPELI
ncbi:MAG: peptidase U32 family protein, partial [Acetivibrio ethanolgignens]